LDETEKWRGVVSCDLKWGENSKLVETCTKHGAPAFELSGNGLDLQEEQVAYVIHPPRLYFRTTSCSNLSALLRLAFSVWLVTCLTCQLRISKQVFFF